MNDLPVTLRVRNLPITNLDLGFAIELPDGKIRHYFVRQSALQDMKDGYYHVNLEDLAAEALLRHLAGHPPVEGPYELDWVEAPRSSGSLSVQEIPARSLPRKIRKALLRKHSDGTLMQENEYRPRFLKPLLWLYNWIAYRIHLMMIVRHIYLLQRMIYVGVCRRVFPAVYLSVKCREADIPEAYERLMTDLMILVDRKAIRGHLAMPSMIELANLVGNGERIFGLFCFPCVDFRVFYPKGTNPLDYKRDVNCLRDAGLRTVSEEGSITNLTEGIEPSWDLVVSTEYIGGGFEELHKKVQDAWVKAVESVKRPKETSD